MLGPRRPSRRAWRPPWLLRREGHERSAGRCAVLGWLGGLVRARPARGSALARVASARLQRGCCEAELRRHAVMPPPRPHCHLFCSGVSNHDPNHGFTGAQGAARPMLVGQQGVAVQARSDPPQRVVQASSSVSHRERRSSLSSCEASRFEVQQGGNTTEGGKRANTLASAKRCAYGFTGLYEYTVRLYCTS